MAFRYLCDPLFLACVVLYFVNRWVLKSAWPGGFCHSHFNDLICIPFWVPIMVWLLRKARLRSDDEAPRGCEIAIPLIVWAALFELALPHVGPLRGLAVSDHKDVLFYSLGALIATAFWRLYYHPRPRGIGAIRLTP